MNIETHYCTVCSSILLIEDKITAFHYHCDNCGYEELEYATNGKCCILPDVKSVRDYQDESEALQNSDDYRVYNQCLHCGKRIGTALKKSKYEKNSLPVAINLNDEKRAAEKEIVKIADRIRNKQKLINENSFWNLYSEYLNSERWHEICKIILKRDKYICQSCLTETATEVHHTEGRYRMNEPLFTLVSVCRRCHEIITEIDRGHFDSANEIRYEFDKMSLKGDA
jgi:hypothetical protein